MASWLRRVLADKPGFERDLVERYTERLIELARHKLTNKVRRRVDPEDVVQSVYRSFFRRLKDGRLSLADSSDLWHLLAAMTYHRTTKAVRFHLQQRRDVRREAALAETDASSAGPVARDPSLRCGTTTASKWQSLRRTANRLSPPAGTAPLGFGQCRHR